MNSRTHFSTGWRVGDRVMQRGRLPLLMGILNVTPDSFSDGGEHQSVAAAVSHGLALEADGADMIDVGGESTRPGSESVSATEELSRVVPVIAELSTKITAPISIDTTKAVVAQAAIEAGASIVNDISGMTFDQDMASVCRAADVAVCVMHIKGTPKTMQQQPAYQNVVAEVEEFLTSRMNDLISMGISPERICLDPGIGFGKTAEHNLTLMRSIAQMKERLQRPLLIGHSRKRFLSRVLGREVEERLAGTIGVSVALAQNGTDILRIHDVKASRDALTAWRTIVDQESLP